MKRYLLYLAIIILSSGLVKAQTISMPSLTSYPCQTKSFPLVASDFPVDDVAAITLYIYVDPDVISYINHSPGTLTGYSLVYNASLGRIVIFWTYSPPSPPTPPDPPNINGTLLTINFQYSGGFDTLTFGSGCEISSLGPPAENILTDYTNGLIGPVPLTYYYVDHRVGSSGNGLSWGTALKKISEATNKPLAPGSKVLIWPGNYSDTVIIKSNGNETVPLEFGVSVSDTNKITFPASANFTCLDVEGYPGSYYAYVYRSWKGNNGVYKITSVNKSLKYVIVEGAAFVPESGAVGDSALLQASIGMPVIYEKFSSNPLAEHVTLSPSSIITEERATLHIGKPTSPGEFNVSPANYNIIDGIDVTGADNYGVRIQNSKHNVYQNSRIYELDSIAFLISGNSANPANNNFILNNTIYNTSKKAVKIGIQDIASQNNRANLNHIKNNVICSAAGTNINFINAIDICNFTGYSVIENNTVRNFKLKDDDRGAIEIRNNVRGVLIYSNYLKNIDRLNVGVHAMIYLQNLGSNNNVFNNVIVDSAATANDVFAFWVKANEGYTAGKIAYNTVHKVDNGFKLESGSSNVNFEIKNNIMNIDPTEPEYFSITGNGLYDVSYNCYPGDAPQYAGEAGRIIGDPSFFLPSVYQSPYAFTLQSGSICLNSGNPITGITIDFRHASRNVTNPSMGAFERVLNDANWTGEISSNWHDYRNWDVKLVPLSDYHVVIPDRSNDPIISNENVTIKSLLVSPAAQINVTNSKTLILTN